MMKGISGVSAEEVECSMCGDVGLPDKLFLCKTRDCHRHQHTYCSNWYPEERSANAGLCNWCAAAAAGSSDKGNVDKLNGTSRRGAAASTSATIKGGTMSVESGSAPLKIIMGNHAPSNLNTVHTAHNNSSSGAKPKAAGYCKTASATRTAAGRRYKLVSEM